MLPLLTFTTPSILAYSARACKACVFATEVMPRALMQMQHSQQVCDRKVIYSLYYIYIFFLYYEDVWGACSHCQAMQAIGSMTLWKEKMQFGFVLIALCLSHNNSRKFMKVQPCPLRCLSYSFLLRYICYHYHFWNVVTTFAYFCYMSGSVYSFTRSAHVKLERSVITNWVLKSLGEPSGKKFSLPTQKVLQLSKLPNISTKHIFHRTENLTASGVEEKLIVAFQ